MKLQSHTKIKDWTEIHTLLRVIGPYRYRVHAISCLNVYYPADDLSCQQSALDHSWHEQVALLSQRGRAILRASLYSTVTRTRYITTVQCLERSL